MAIMYMMVGNIGTGKTTTAKLLMDDKTLYVSEDLLAPMMNDGRYDPGVWTTAHFKVYQKLKLAAAEGALSNGFDLILDGTNIAIENRSKYIEAAKKWNATIICYVFLDNKLGLRNRLRNQRGQPASMWKRVSANLQRKFEMPTREEGIDKVIVMDTYLPLRK